MRVGCGDASPLASCRYLGLDVVACESDANCPSAAGFCDKGRCSSKPASAEGEGEGDPFTGAMLAYDFEALPTNATIDDVSGNGFALSLNDANPTLVPNAQLDGNALSLDPSVAPDAQTTFMASSLNAFTISFCVADWQTKGARDMPFAMGGTADSLPGIDAELGTDPWAFHIVGNSNDLTRVPLADVPLAGAQTVSRFATVCSFFTACRARNGAAA